MSPPSTFWEDNPKLRSLLLVLIAIFLLSGLVLVVLSQMQQSYRNKIYLETEQSLPKH